MNTDIEYKKGVLLIKVKGLLVGNKTEIFESEVIPIILGLNADRVTISLLDVDLIDNRGINSLIKISSIVNRFNGKVVLCDLNKYIKNRLKQSDVYDYCFKSRSEKTSMGVFSI